MSDFGVFGIKYVGSHAGFRLFLLLLAGIRIDKCLFLSRFAAGGYLVPGLEGLVTANSMGDLLSF